MERVIRFFQENPLQFCTAVGRDDSPGVRPFQMMYAEGNDLHYCTGAKKEVYAELSAGPRPERLDKRAPGAHARAGGMGGRPRGERARAGGERAGALHL